VFNYKGEKTGIYCVEHKHHDMVDVVSNKCHYPECTTQPSFNYVGETCGIYCAQHMEKGMIDVRSQKCKHVGCTTVPIFNYEGQTIGTYCASHALKDMVDVRNKKCLETGCTTQPTFNNKGETQAIYCIAHKKKDMIDVKHEICKMCDSRAYYNHEGETKGVCCYDHKTPTMINVKEPICLTPFCSTSVTKKHEGYCLRCFIHMFPDNPIARNYKTKERAVVEYVLHEFPDKTWITDKRVINGCSRRRPDLCLDMGSHLIMTEVDENQHMDYDCSCENKRLMELSLDVGHRPIVFVRFNPDDYTQSNKSVTSCWGVDKKGICVVKKTKQKEWEHRLVCLKDQIQYWIENVPDKTVEVVQLFFDQ
jgi:hypothetical protein